MGDPEPLPATIWVAVLTISAATETKINALHQVGGHEVQDEVVCVSGLAFRWDDSPDRGLRALVSVTIRNRRATVVLYPADTWISDSWNLGSVYFERPL